MILAYFRSKRQLIAERDTAKERRNFAIGQMYYLTATHRYLEKQMNDLRLELKERDATIRAMEIEKDVILRTVVGLGPMIVAEVARVKSL